MDLNKVLQPFLDLILANLPSLIVIFTIVLIVAICRTRWFKGWFGEKFVSFWLRRSLNADDYQIHDDILLPTEDGTTQIDHIIISPFGIFVVETKNWKGWIFGSENQSQWTVQIYGHKNKTQNPLRQNYKHTRTLAEHTGLAKSKFHSLIVLVGECELKTEMPENVVDGAGSAVKFIRSKTEVLLTAEEIQETVDVITENRLVNSRKTRKQHVRHVEEIKARKADESRCPRCGGDLVLRTVSKGENKENQFWGCQKFPKCRGRREVTA